MTYAELTKLFEDNDIPKDAKLQSDSGWECCATDLERAYYNRKTNTVVFTQHFSEWYDNSAKWKRLAFIDGKDTFLQ